MKNGRVLITGLTGFTGRYLRHTLVERGYEVQGTSQEPEPGDAGVHCVDLLDAPALAALVGDFRPTHVVHLAAISFVAHGDAQDIYATNIIGTRNLLQALAGLGAGHMRCALLASSANIYGNALHSPIRETEPPCPANDYAVSKLAMEHMANLWAGAVPVTVVRPFNYTGVGQASHFVVPKIVNAFRDRAPRLELGNIDVERDLSDVRDMVEAYARLLEAAPGGAFNICSGRSISLGEIMAIASELTGYSPAVVVNPAFVRANEVRRLCGSNEKLLSAIGPWTPRPMRQTLEWMLASGDAFGKLTA
jgi:nucleoside-diphosphate-sugar epimerase